MSKEGIIKKFGSHDRKRLFPGARGAAPHNKANRQKEALERDAFWAKLTPQEQLAALDKRLGKGVGAEKQRARIQARIDEAAKAPAAAGGSKDLHLKAKDRRAAERAERPSR